MAIFGRRKARQRLRRAARESLTIPRFSYPPDCSLRVNGGLRSTELALSADETSSPAKYLEADPDTGDGQDGGGTGHLDTTHHLGNPGTSAALLPSVEKESGDARLRRMLAFVAHQEPRLNWAVGDQPDGTTVLVTDLAHGWIPPSIALPEGTRLLAPALRTGKVATLVGNAVRSVVYAPGDALGRPADPSATKSSGAPRMLPATHDVLRQVAEATYRRDGLPRLVHTLASAADAGTSIVADEIDLLRVQLDTARHQIFVQYPDIDLPLLLNGMLLAAAEGGVSGDLISANYHFSWFQKLVSSATGERTVHQ